MRLWVILLAGFLLVGCNVPENQSSSPSPTTSARVVTTAEQREVSGTHTFQAGDTLWSLANRYLGSGSRWTEIAELNGIEDETAIPDGTVLSIPSTAPVATQAPATTRAAATSASCSLEEEGRDLVREWNRVSGELLAMYMDASATGDQYIETSEQLLPVLNRVVQDLRSLRGCIPAEERILFEPFLGTYNDKFSGYSALETGVRIGSPAAQEDAIAILMEANRRSVAMVCEIARASGQELPGADVC